MKKTIKMTTTSLPIEIKSATDRFIEYIVDRELILQRYFEKCNENYVLTWDKYPSKITNQNVDLFAKNVKLKLKIDFVFKIKDDKLEVIIPPFLHSISV